MEKLRCSRLRLPVDTPLTFLTGKFVYGVGDPKENLVMQAVESE